MSLPVVSPDECMESLAAQVPGSSRQQPPVVPHLQQILSLCRRRWVCDFLFNSDPLAALTVLTAPFNIRSAVVCNVTTKRFGPRILAYPYALHVRSSIVFVPAHSADDISVGFGIEETSYSSTHSFDCEKRAFPTPVPSYNVQFRYVRDDKAGMLIILYEKDHSFQFNYVAHLNTQNCRRSTCRFDKQTLLSLIETETHLDGEKLLRAMHCLQSAEEFRSCPICGAKYSTPCGCSLGLVVPAHSLDFSNHASQMFSYVGSFEGMVHSAMYSGGRLRGQEMLGSNMTLEGGNDRHLIERLSRWAISKGMQKVCPPDPMSYVLPLAVQPEEWDNATTPLTLHDTSTSDAVDFTERMQDIFGLKSGGVTVETSRTVVPESFVLDCTPNYAPTVTSLAFEPPVLGTVQTDPAHVSDLNPPQPRESLYPVMAVADAENSPQGAVAMSNLPVEDIMPLTPAEQLALAKEREKEIKLAKKKERNRASAHRSNLKKSLELKARKKELEELKTMEANLRARERELRTANKELRLMLERAS